MDFITSIAIILISGLIVSYVFTKLGLPGLLGMLIVGIVLGPYNLNLININILNISADLRKIALIVILLRAGLGLDRQSLTNVGKNAIMMSSIPCILEGLAIAIISSYLLNFSFIEGGMLGFIIAAVSPAVVVPAMLSIMDKVTGDNKKIPTLILAGASIDDVFAITLFSIFLSMYTGSKINVGSELLGIPLSIFLGILIGVIAGLILSIVFKKYRIRDTKKLLTIFAVSILLTTLEANLKGKLEIASLLGVMTIGIVLFERLPDVTRRLSVRLNKVWVLAEIFLFVLVGAEVNINVAVNAGIKGIIIILFGLIARSIGVIISTKGYTFKQRLFCIIAFTPKATVQAAMGSVPLMAGVVSGELILAIAVMAILITAPLGAVAIKLSQGLVIEQ